MSDTDAASPAPTLSIIIPIYNEEEILRDAVCELRDGLATLGHSYEIVLAENGSSDGTIALAAALSDEFPEVHSFSAPEPNYGLALRLGILKARGTFVVCDEIDLCDLDFYIRALDLLLDDAADMVVGSKAMPGAYDSRPLFRRVATRVINGMLRVAVDFRGTDTHGLKAFRRDLVVPVVNQCVVDRDIFASELVVRAGRARLNVVEIPVEVCEKRRPAINLFRRVPGVLKNMAQLTYAIRFKG
jgi:glycosyltransferase involved in cell wall biosynthesis